MHNYISMTVRSPFGVRKKCLLTKSVQLCEGKMVHVHLVLVRGWDTEVSVYKSEVSSCRGFLKCLAVYSFH